MAKPAYLQGYYYATWKIEKIVLADIRMQDAPIVGPNVKFRIFSVGS